jgi:hypothetical protein
MRIATPARRALYGFDGGRTDTVPTCADPSVQIPKRPVSIHRSSGPPATPCAYGSGRFFWQGAESCALASFCWLTLPTRFCSYLSRGRNLVSPRLRLFFRVFRATGLHTELHHAVMEPGPVARWRRIQFAASIGNGTGNRPARTSYIAKERFAARDESFPIHNSWEHASLAADTSSNASGSGDGPPTRFLGVPENEPDQRVRIVRLLFIKRYRELWLFLPALPSTLRSRISFLRSMPPSLSKLKVFHIRGLFYNAT